MILAFDNKIIVSIDLAVHNKNNCSYSIMTRRDGSRNSIYWDGKGMYEPTVEDVIGGQFPSLEEATYFCQKY